MGTTFDPTAPSLMGGQQPGYSTQPISTTFDPTSSGQHPSQSESQDLPPSYEEVVRNNPPYGWT